MFRPKRISIKWIPEDDPGEQEDEAAEQQHDVDHANPFLRTKVYISARF
jgi:hypothetical protein